MRARRDRRAFLRLLIGLGALTCGGCGRQSTPQTLKLAQLRPGLSYGQFEATTPQGPTVLTHVVRLDPRVWRLVHVNQRETGVKLTDAGHFRRAVGAVAAVNGIYFDPAYRPLGLMISDGTQRSPLRRVDHGVFAVKSSKPILRHAHEWKPSAEVTFAAECGPRLVVRGKPLRFKPGLARRTVIGADRAGLVYLVVTEGVITLQDLAALLARPVAARGIGLSDALNLDGGSSTMLSVAAAQTQVTVRSAVRIPAGIAVLPLAQSVTETLHK